MMKWLWFLLAMPAMAQTTLVVGKLQTYNPLAAPNALGNYVEFQLTNCGNNTPTVSGSAVLLSKPIDFYPDSTGALTASANGGSPPTLYGNDVINCGGAYTSRYSVRYFVGGVPQGPAKFYQVSSTVQFNLTTAIPIGLQPPLNPPYPNLTTCAPGSYSNGLNPDLSVKCLNLPNGASNAVVTNPTATQEIANQPLILDGILSGPTATFNSTNGVLNAAMFPGSDIGAKANAAYATCSLACEVDIPAGSYTYSTGIVMPNSASTTLRMSPGAVLNYVGSGYAIKTSQGPNWGGGLFQGFYFIHGGLIFGSSSAKAGILLNAATSGIHVTGTAVTGFTAGDGILDVGSNSVKIESSKVVGNLVGIHLMASPMFASNNVLVERTGIAQNVWGVINGDVSQWTIPWVFTGTTGVSSPNYNATFFMNTFEGNTAGAAIDGLTVGTQYLNNYLEGNPRGIVLGMVTTPLTSGQYTALYGISGMNGGTARTASVVGGFFNTDPSIHSLVELRAAAQPTIDRNSTDSGTGSAACFVDEYISTNPYVGWNDPTNVAALLCVGGSPGWSSTAQIPEPVAITGTVTASDAGSRLGPITNNNGSNPVALLGGIQVFTANQDPTGTCGAAGATVLGAIWITGDGLWVCQGSGPTSITGTWTHK